LELIIFNYQSLKYFKNSVVNKMGWNIGSEAREIDSKSLKERLKIEKTTIKRIGFAVLFYFVTMVIFSIVI